MITTNVDHQFQKAGFDKKRLFYTQGDYGLFQSVNKNNKKTYDIENKKSSYACINYKEAFCPDEILDRSIIINEDIDKVLDDIMEPHTFVN